MEDYREIIFILIGGAIGFLFSYFTKYFSKKGENQATKEDIKEITNKIEEAKIFYTKKVEHLKKDLQIIINENQIRFSTLHVKRAKVLQKIYIKLYKLQSKMSPLIEEFEFANLERRMDLYAEANNLLRNYYSNYSQIDLFLTGEIDTQIKEYFDTVKKTIKEASQGSHHQDKGQSLETEKHIEVYMKGTELSYSAWKKINEEIPELRNKIKLEFRKILNNSYEGAI